MFLFGFGLSQWNGWVYLVLEILTFWVGLGLLCCTWTYNKVGWDLKFECKMWFQIHNIVSVMLEQNPESINSYFVVKPLDFKCLSPNATFIVLLYDNTSGHIYKSIIVTFLLISFGNWMWDCKSHCSVVRVLLDTVSFLPNT